METLNQILIRRAEPGEADALTQIAISAKRHWNYPQRWMEIWIPELTFDSKYFEANESWAAELAGIPIGFYTLQERNGKAWLENLWVSAEYIGRGAGKQLFLHALTRSRALGYTILQLEADPNALGFYEKMGMVKSGEHQSAVEGQLRNIPVLEIVL